LHVTQLRLVDFRSYPEINVSFSPGNILLVGENGQGKTNLVEAIAYLANFRSHRATQAATLIRQGTNQAIVQARLQDGQRAAVLDAVINLDKANVGRLNGKAVNNVRELAGILKTVVFAPEDNTLAKGEPTVRRRYLDDLLVQLKPASGKLLADYDRTAKQRAALLKSIRQRGLSTNLATQLEVWNENLIRTATPIISLRRELLKVISEPTAEIYRSLSDSGERLQLGYDSAEIPADIAAEQVAEQLAKQINRLNDNEIARGVNLVGPHLDDMKLTLEGLDVRRYASNGESWSVALALRIAAYEVLRGSLSIPGDSPLWLPAANGHHEPVLVLDDVFAQLDPKRRSRLTKLTAGAEQIFITAPSRADLPTNIAGQEFRVVANTLTPLGSREKARQVQ